MKKFTLLFLFVLIFRIGAFSQSAADFHNYNMANTPTFTSNNFKAIAIGKGGHIWAGTQYGGLYKYDPVSKTWSKSTALSNVFINDIKTDKDGGIWVAQSGKSGSVGGGGNIDGGIDYFPEASFIPMNFYSVTGTGGLTSRNVRSLWIDSSRYNGASNPRVWAAQASFITQFNATRGGIGLGLNSKGNSFGNITNGIQEYAAVIPGCLAVGGNKDEVWVMAQPNYGKSQILRYHPGVSSGIFRGAFDHENVKGNIFSNGFRASAIYFDNDGRQWIGLQAGGIVVKQNALWTKLTDSEIFPTSITINNNAITGDEEGNIYIGTSDGLVIFRGGNVRDPANFERYTTDDGLPSNYVSGIAVDTLNDQILLTTSNGVSFWKINRKIKVKLAWDYSFPLSDIKPKGVAADGVARLYLKIRRGSDTIPKFKNVQVISDKYEAVDRSLRGRLKVPFVLNRYSEEASGFTFTDVERTDSTRDGYFWFWYVSPEDFSVDDIGGNAEKAERRDDLKIMVTFTDDRKDSTIFSMKVVRPPLLLVHGLASNPGSFDGLKHNYAHDEPVRFTESPLFKYKKALTMNGRGPFEENAQRLLGGDLQNGENILNTLQGNLVAMRKMGYAVNQVDYLCHSMGGIMIRGAIGWYHNKFFANGDYEYNNYKKGFVHKMITVNTPHNSSPLADAVAELIPQAPTPINIMISRQYRKDPSPQLPWDFIRPVDPDFFYYSKWKASDAIRDLQVTNRNGGINLPVTENVKNHRIVGDINLNIANVSGSIDVELMELMNKLNSNSLLRIARDYAGVDKSYLTSFLDPAYSDINRAIALFNWYGKRKGFTDFAGDGDFIVPLRSQTANKSKNAPEISLFENPIGTGFNTMHTSIMTRLDVGNRILQLLNSPLNNNPAFVNSIEANADSEPALRTNNLRINSNVSVTSYFDTSAIVVSAPSRTAITTYADSILLIKFSIKDTVGLAYININFQGTDSFRISRNSSQEIAFKINAVETGNQMLMATAVYDKGDSVKYFCDTLNLMVENLGVLQGFRIDEEEADLTDKLFFHPQYQVKYNDEWIRLSSGDPLIKIAFNPGGFVGFDTATASFKALQQGFSQVYLTYRGFKDTISFNSVIELAVEDLTFTGKVLLQGAYNSVTKVMNTTLNSLGILPQVTSQPYSDTAFRYYGTEKTRVGFFAANPNIVDWIMVELRDPDLQTAVVATRAGFVKNDGTLVDTSGANGITFNAVPPGNYYVVIKHRNHIAIRSSALINFSDGSGNYDFTRSLSSAFAGSVSNNPMATLATGVYGLWGGNANNDRTIKMTGLRTDSNDYLKLLNRLGTSTATISNTYSKQDINMDGKINMSGVSSDINDYLKLSEILGSSINQIYQPAF